MYICILDRLPRKKTILGSPIPLWWPVPLSLPGNRNCTRRWRRLARRSWTGPRSLWAGKYLDLSHSACVVPRRACTLHRVCWTMIQAPENYQRQFHMWWGYNYISRGNGGSAVIRAHWSPPFVAKHGSLSLFLWFGGERIAVHCSPMVIWSQPGDRVASGKVFLISAVFLSVTLANWISDLCHLNRNILIVIKYSANQRPKAWLS